MFDHITRRWKDALLAPLLPLAARLTPIQISLLGLLLAGVAFGLLATGRPFQALPFWLLNRVADGLDGLVARRTARQSDFGGYIDILADFAAYALIPLGVVLGAQPAGGWLALALLLATFYVNAASWIYLSALLEKRHAGAAALREPTSVTMPAGLIAGSETIVFYTLMIALPTYSVWLFGLMTAGVLVGIGQRLVWARRHLGAAGATE